MNKTDNKTKINSSVLQKKIGRKVSLSLHVMPQDQGTGDVRIFSWLIGGLLILSSLIIFLMIYV